MENDSEILALINLVDDSDEAIYFQIKDKILSYGLEVVPYLEEAWEIKDYGEEFQTRIENIIHEIQFNNVLESLLNWVSSGGKDLLKGILLINKYHFPDLDVMAIYDKIKAIAEKIALKILPTANLQRKTHVLNEVLFTEEGFIGDTDDYYSPNNSLLNRVLERKRGNPILLSILYIELARMIDLPIVGINLPRHFIVGVKDEVTQGIAFYLSPFNKGNSLTKEDIDAYLEKINLPKDNGFYAACSHLDMAMRVLLNLINSYKKRKNKEKYEELNELYQAIKDKTKDR